MFAMFLNQPAGRVAFVFTKPTPWRDTTRRDRGLKFEPAAYPLLQYPDLLLAVMPTPTMYAFIA